MAEKGEKNPKKLIVIALVAVLVIGAVAGGTWWFLLRNKDEAGVTRKVEEDFYQLGEFTVNLAESRKSVFIRVKISLGYEKNSKAAEELTKYNSKIRDSINMLLLTKTEEEVKDAFGIEQLKRQIKLRLDSIVEEVVITDVYFVDIAIQ